MPEVKIESMAKPFDEAVQFFQDKLNIPTKRFDDLIKGMHAKGFMVAGVMKADLLSDMRGAVDRAVSRGDTLEDFRKNFDSIVEKHGWVYKGGRNWRTKVIYHTNVRSSYNAGRWKQMNEPDVVKLRPYFMYRHSGSAHPRKEHLAWHGLVLAYNDPFWNTHTPQNGWGCNCRLDSLSKRDLKKMRKSGPDSAPKIKHREYKDRDGKKHKVPVGIDPGFDYNVGKAADKSYKVLADRFETLDYKIAKPWMNDFLQGPVFKRFYDGKIKGEFPVAVLSPEDKKILGSKAQTVWLSKTTIKDHKIKHPEILLDDYLNIPEIIENGEVYKQGDARLVLLYKKDKLYRAALKRTKDRKENYYLTLFEIDEGRADRQVRNKYERIR
ncbi:MAG: hypothetical protein L3J69_06065 [Desulfobacula sp.]|nr:hypothetical protein [Desulfobacula sp.]